jgi:glycolate oxidase
MLAEPGTGLTLKGVTPMGETATWLTIPEIVRAARTALPTHIWDFSCGGAESETALRRNRAAFDHYAFRTRVLRGVENRTVSTTFLGHSLDLPVMLAPVGSIVRFDPDGALASARAAHRSGTVPFVGTLNSPSMDEVREGTTGPLFFQMYVRGDRPWMEAMIRRVESAGYSGICLTVDSGSYGRRERDLHNRYFAREGGGRTQPNLEGLPRPSDRLRPDQYQSALTWEDVDWMRETTRLPLMLKGILDARDAVRAVEHGVDVVYVSNHGGRQIDHVPATFEVLPEIVQAVRGRAEVIVDSGFMRGADVIKAVALGARAVLIGKLMTWALAAGGEDGLACALDILKTEIRTTMGNIGARSIDEIDPDCVRPSVPPPAEVWPYGANPALEW